MTIRPAVPADAAALAELAERTSRDTFAADNTAADMDAHCAATYSADIQSRELANPAIRTLVVQKEDGGLAAFAQILEGPAPACISGDAPVELWRFYVDRPFHGRGLAQQLMAHAEATAVAMHRRTLWLGVWERNLRAQAFYRKCGFAVAGTHTFMMGYDPQNDYLMVKELQHGIA